MFLPTTTKEMLRLGWKELDIILVSGDAYIDSSFVGVAVIGKVLVAAGFRVGIIGQPEITTSADIMRLGVPKLFWGVTAGCIDSMVANRTATGKRRKSDDYTPGGLNNKRPDRATIVYTNLIKRYFTDNPRPIVLGGIEASLRRIAHYDSATDSIRRSILFDTKADYLLYGMAERSILDFSQHIKEGKDPRSIGGLCYVTSNVPETKIKLPGYEEVSQDKEAFTRSFKIFYKNNDPVTASTVVQKHGNRYLVQNPPAEYLCQRELDAIYNLKYERDLHPYHKRDGHVKALETIRFAISTHRGCYAECSFCAIAVHEGRRVRSRSRASIVAEAKAITAHPYFKGRIHDIGGPTANMYASYCKHMAEKGCCIKKSCLSPEVCPSLVSGHKEQISLLKAVSAVKGVKQAVVASGVRYDMVLSDKKYGAAYLKKLVADHVSGRMKIAPEHTEPGVLNAMNKQGCGKEKLLKFRELFYKLTKESGKKQYLSYYLMAAHPGCRVEEMKKLRQFTDKELGGTPDQVQVFTPTPSTRSTLIYWTGRDMNSVTQYFVEKGIKEKERQKMILTGKRKKIRRDRP